MHSHSVCCVQVLCSIVAATWTQHADTDTKLCCQCLHKPHPLGRQAHTPTLQRCTSDSIAQMHHECQQDMQHLRWCLLLTTILNCHCRRAICFDKQVSLASASGQDCGFIFYRLAQAIAASCNADGHHRAAEGLCSNWAHSTQFAV